MKLDANNAVPLYEQMKIQLQEQISVQVYAAGDRLPSETELCEKYGVSRITVRRALDELVSEGILERKQGKGTFVAAKKSRILFRPLESMGSGFSDSTYLGSEKRILVIAKKEREGNRSEREALALSDGEKVFEFRRLMFLDGQPFMLDDAVYPSGRFPGLFERVKDNISTYSLLRESYGIAKMLSQRELSFSYATDEQAKLLGCQTGGPLFRIYKRVWDKDGCPVHLSRFYMCADRVVFTDEGD